MGMLRENHCLSFSVISFKRWKHLPSLLLRRSLVALTPPPSLSSQTGPTYVYHGSLRPGEPQSSNSNFYGLTICPREHKRELNISQSDSFPLDTSSVKIFQSQDVLEHIALDHVPSVLNEIFRVLQPGGLFRLSMPDYNVPFLRNRCVFDSSSNIIADLRMFTTVSYNTDSHGIRVTHKSYDSHLWFPTYSSVNSLLLSSKFKYSSINWHHAYIDQNKFIMHDFDHQLCPVKRCPPLDNRNNGKPVSLVVDIYK